MSNKRCNDKFSQTFRNWFSSLKNDGLRQPSQTKTYPEVLGERIDGIRLITVGLGLANEGIDEILLCIPKPPKKLLGRESEKKHFF